MNPTLQRLKKPALIAVGIFVAMLAFAWLALPGIIHWQAEKFIAEKTGHRLSMAKPEINPLSLSLRLRDLRLVDPAGAPLVAFSQLFVDLSIASLTQRALAFDAIELDGLDVTLIQRQQGDINWTPFLDSLKSKEPQPESTGLPRLSIKLLRINGAYMDLADQRRTPAFTTRIEPLDFELHEVSTLADDGGHFKLDATTLGGAKLAWQGDIEPNSLASTGHIDLRDIDLQRLSSLLKDFLPLAPPAGIAAIAADYRLSLGGGTVNLGLDQIKLALTALRIQKVAGAKAPQLAVDGFEINDGQFDLASKQLALGAIQLQGSRVEAVLDGKARAPVLKLDDIALKEIKVDLARRNATLAALTITGGGIAARRDAKGRIDLLDVLDSLDDKPAAPVAAAKPAPAAAPAEPAPAPWRFRIEHIALSGFGLALRDESVKPALDVALDNIAVAVDGVSQDLDAALPLKASLDARSGGRLEIDGKVMPAAAAADFQLTLNDLALKVAQPYVAKFAALDLVGGQITAAGRVTHNVAGGAKKGSTESNYRGSFAVRDLRLNEAGTKNVFLAWKSLSTKEVEVSPSRLNMALLSLDGLDTKLIIDKDKSTNLTRVLRGDAAVPPAPTSAAATPAPAPTPAPTPKPPVAATPAAAPGFLVNIDRLRFRNGALFFSDASLVFPFATRVHSLQGSLIGLSSRPGGAPGQVELDGEVDEYGLARAVGQVDFFKPTDFMDLKVIFRNVEMTRLTPYSATFAGRKINSGKLSLELEYKIKQRQLLGDNRVIIDSLELGDRVESPTAMNLPLDLAIAILSDSDGRIDLGMPISGSLDDPQFSYGGIIWKAIVNVLGKIVTAPFRALGALFGGGGEQLDNIVFEAGAPGLTPPEREKLVRIAAVLNKRPKLAVNVHGTWAEVDRVAQQDLQLRRKIADKAGLAGAKGDPGPLSTGTPKVQSALESLFGDQFGGAELAALKEGFRKANPGQLEEGLTGKMMSRLTGLMREKRSLSEAEVGQLKGADFHGLLFERLRAKESVKDDAMQALATQRGDYALAALKAAGAPEARIAKGAAEKAETESREVQLKLDVGKAGG